MLTLQFFILMASGLPASTYGHGESFCGDYGQPAVVCNIGSQTASGELFDPEAASAALAMPRRFRMRPTHVWLRTDTSTCVKVKIIDKMHERFIGQRGFDLSPKAIELLTGQRSKHFLRKVYLC